jgi:hypothetical protein
MRPALGLARLFGAPCALARPTATVNPGFKFEDSNSKKPGNPKF